MCLKIICDILGYILCLKIMIVRHRGYDTGLIYHIVSLTSDKFVVSHNCHEMQIHENWLATIVEKKKLP